MLFKYRNCVCLLEIKNKLKIGCFSNKVGKNCRYFVGVFNRTIIPLALVGYEMVNYSQLIANAHSWNNC